jgi:dihydroxyacetone kinase-like protein
MSLVRGALVDGPAVEPAAELLCRSGRLLISSVGGASGPLYGTLFLETGQALGNGDRLEALGSALVRGVGGVGRRGRSTVGQKTMLDTLVPAAEALAAGGEPRRAVERAIEAARIGCESTREMVAQRGRASYLGERAVGHLDPGAVSSRLVIEALAVAVTDGQPPAAASIPPRR